MRFDLVRPCGQCPFRSDILVFLLPSRVQEILDAILEEGRTFSCHKTADASWQEDENGNATYAPQLDEQHCAGALLLIDRMGIPHRMTKIAKALGLYDPGKLDRSAPVFASPSAMLAQMIALDQQNA